MGGRTAIHIIAKAFDISEDEVKRRFARLGDLGDVVQAFGGTGRSTLRLKDVYRALHEFKVISGEGSQEKKAEPCASSPRPAAPAPPAAL